MSKKLDDIKNGLWNAARLLEKQGWVQKSYENENGLCALGAIVKANMKGWDFALPEQVKAALAIYLTDSSKDIAGDIIRWNDRKGRTKEEVIQTLIDCAESL